MRMNAYVHGSGGKVSDIVAATRQGMSAPSIYTSTPQMAEARDRRVAGVQFTPSALNRPVIYPLDNEARANLTNLYFGVCVGAIAPNASMKLPIIGPFGKFHMVLFTSKEIKQLAEWALAYTYQLYDYADRLYLGQVPPDEPWPSNDYNAARRERFAEIFIDTDRPQQPMPAE
jgi:hypothetical protein